MMVLKKYISTTYAMLHRYVDYQNRQYYLLLYNLHAYPVFFQDKSDFLGLQ